MNSTDIDKAHEVYSAKLRKHNLGGRVWYSSSPYSICGDVFPCGPEFIDHVNPCLHTDGGRMCNHHDERFQDKLSLAMNRILASHDIHDPQTVSIMIDSRVPFLVGPQSTCNIERNWRFTKNDTAQG